MLHTVQWSKLANQIVSIIARQNLVPLSAIIAAGLRPLQLVVQQFSELGNKIP